MADDKKKEIVEGSSIKNTTSPYLLSANDNPGNIITQVQLKGDNYDEWARAMRTALRAKKKFGFIDGSVTQPSDDETTQEDWWTVNSMLVSWILNTIEPTLRSTITYTEIAKDLWDDIKERLSMGNGPRIHQLKSELAECKQQGMTVVNYYGKLKMIWEELANYEQNLTCRCGGCACNIASDLDKRREEERLHQFLMGLDDVVFGTVRSNILSTEPLPNVNRAYAMIVQEERVHSITRGKKQRGEPMAFAVQVASKGRTENKDKNVVCPSCKRTGHTADSCFQLIGYPDWWGDRPRGSGHGNGRGQGGQKQPGQLGGKGRNGPVRANVVQMATSETGQGNETNKSGLSGLSNEQWCLLLNMLNTQKEGNHGKLNGKNNIVDWIIDSGASHHMTGSPKMVSDLQKVLPCSVGLPDGKQVTTEQEGIVVLDGDLKLKNVLYVPHLNCSLISVSQLTKELDCIVQFDKDSCVLQDHKSRMLIGVGEECRGDSCRKPPKITILIIP